MVWMGKISNSSIANLQCGENFPESMGHFERSGRRPMLLVTVAIDCYVKSFYLKLWIEIDGFHGEKLCILFCGGTNESML